ncbi:MAG TPA: FUSC family protein [Geminicoccus sp.]|uniref:FUSC family protein n=1 Tax=Geminicoccus sp. TaxID=2024832 RepID=UPI002BB79D02|nr:FUSC family protein [Geminicoccus sp.]HWL69698.1 FUSC family protein [Geminicoccus sp.]
MPSVAAVPQPLTFAGFSGASWSYAIRIWLAVVTALYVSFWLELDTPSSAAITVAILALPTRGLALDKAVFRLLATVLGVAASFVIVGMFTQSDVIMLWVFAAWIGLCVFVVGMLDGNRAYAASLGVTTVAIVAIEQTDTPQQVFDVGIARGSAIVVGILAITFINDFLGAPDHYPKVSARLRSLQDRVTEYGRSALRGQAMPAAAAAGLLREITALRPDVASLAAESSSGRARAASARSAMVELVVAFAAARALAGLSGPAPGPAGHVEPPVRPLWGDDPRPADDLIATARAWLASEFRQRMAELQDSLDRLQSGKFPEIPWQAPLYRSRRIALEEGLRAGLYFVLASTLLGMADWPSVTAALAFVALLIGLSATAPDQAAFTKLAVLIAPLACVMAGILQFVVLDGATGFPMLAIGLAPFIIVCALLMTLSNPLLSSVGRLNMVFILALVAPSNPQNYDPESFLVACLFVCLAASLLFALQLVVPPMSPKRKVRQLLAEARQDLGRPQSEWRGDLAREEAAFQAALRVGQIADLAAGDPAALDQAMASFDQAAALRRCSGELDMVENSALADAMGAARHALLRRDGGLLMNAALGLRAAAARNGLPVPPAGAAMVAAAMVLPTVPPSAMEQGT